MLTRSELADLVGERPIIGVVHLRPLPGSPQFVSMASVLEQARGDALAISQGGAAGMLFENFGDAPFFKKVPAETVAAMTRVITEVTSEVQIPFGVNVLRNDGEAAVAIAAATGAAFLRVNVLVGAMLTDQGVIEGEAAMLMRMRRNLAPDVLVFADFLVKHAAPMAEYDVDQLAKDMRLRAGADALIVSGSETGSQADPNRLRRLRNAIDAPLLVGSGLTAKNAALFRDIADGAIVGTSIKRNGVVSEPVDANRVREIVAAFR